MKRMEQGVPVETLDIRACDPHWLVEEWLHSLSDIAVDVLGPEGRSDAKLWAVVHDPFIDNDHSDSDEE